MRGETSDSPAVPPLISVLIPAYNEEALIGETLASVRGSFGALGREDYEVIVCDNNSTDGTASVAGAAGALVVAEAHNQIGRARNTAAKAARGKWLIFLDADSLMNDAVLGRTLELLGGGKVGAGGALLSMESGALSGWVRWMLETWNRISATASLAAGSYLYCLREAWEGVGGFDETVYAGEEIDFSRKLKSWLRRRGMRFVIIRDARVTTSARKIEWYSRGQLFGHIWRVMLPGRRRAREHCGLWYERPEKLPAKDAEITHKPGVR